MKSKKTAGANRLIQGVIAGLISISLLTACNAVTDQGSATSTTSPVAVQTSISVAYDSDDENSGWNTAGSTAIRLSGSTAVVEGDGVAVSGGKVTITSAGTYVISGAISNGQILVDTQDKGTVRLILNGADISCADSAPIYIANAKKTVITLAEGTENKVSDGDLYIIGDDEANEPNAAIFSKSDLTINGTGSLSVDANYNNGITGKDELKIVSGNIRIDAVGNGIKGKDYTAVKTANITINAGSDGLKSTNDEDADKGFVLIESGVLNITAGEDAIQAETSVLVRDGTLTLTSGGGSANGVSRAGGEAQMQGGMNGGGTPPADSVTPVEGNMGTQPNAGVETATETDETSMKGIKAVVDIIIAGGNLQIDSADDALHSNNSLTVSGGTIKISSGDDGIHSDTVLEIKGGDIDIAKSYEGIESAAVTIDDGTIHLISSDDGINVAGGNDDSAVNGRPGQNSFNSSGSNTLTINGGYVFMDAAGDGLDANGSISITDGTVIVNGPVSNNNGALDYDGSFKMTGGLLVAAGSSGMAQAPDTSSTQYSVMVNFSQTMTAGTMVTIQDDKGAAVLSFVPTKQYQSVVVCSPDLKKGSSYTVSYGGSATGTMKDGIYSGGTYTAGTKLDGFTVSEAITTVGTSGNGGRGGAGGMGGGRPQ